MPSTVQPRRPGHWVRVAIFVGLLAVGFASWMLLLAAVMGLPSLVARGLS